MKRETRTRANGPATSEYTQIHTSLHLFCCIASLGCEKVNPYLLSEQLAFAIAVAVLTQLYFFAAWPAASFIRTDKAHTSTYKAMRNMRVSHQIRTQVSVKLTVIARSHTAQQFAGDKPATRHSVCVCVRAGSSRHLLIRNPAGKQATGQTARKKGRAPTITDTGRSMLASGTKTKRRGRASFTTRQVPSTKANGWQTESMGEAS